MTHDTISANSRDEWQLQLANVVRDPKELLQELQLEHHIELSKGLLANKLFPLRVPRAFLSKIEKNNPNDPLLLQVITQQYEFNITKGFSEDPLLEQQNSVPGILHKYRNRALLLVKTDCAINCRYCFRRHFPYQHNAGNKHNWQQALHYITQDPNLNEIILSGGDPLMAKDHELLWLLEKLETIPHIKRVRIHSRLISIIPTRATTELCRILSNTTLQCLLVTHINHPNEIQQDVEQAITKLKYSGVTLLNQSVLLKNINDNATTLASLSDKLFDIGILPYYLHLLDKVQGAAHFLVTDTQARTIMQQLVKQLPGYLVPRLCRELGGEASKTLIPY